MNPFFQFLFVLITTGFFVVANVIAAQWAKTGQNLLWIPIFISSTVGYILFGLLVRQSNLTISAGLVDVLIVVLTVMIGIFIFKDMVNIQQAIGLAFACLAVLLLMW